MKDNKENMMTSTLSEDSDIVISGAVDCETIIDGDSDAGDSDVSNFMKWIANPKIMKAYRSIRSDIYGYGDEKRRQVSKKEKQKKKAKRRMSKKSRKR